MFSSVLSVAFDKLLETFDNWVNVLFIIGIPTSRYDFDTEQ